jgi:hypothetical protein
LEINNAAARLHEKLKNLDLNPLTISDYNKRYFHWIHSFWKYLSDKGFKGSPLSGYYGSSSNIMKLSLGFVLNMIITGLKKRGLLLAPFYTIYATRVLES